MQPQRWKKSHPELDMKYLFLFDDTHHAIMGEKKLLESGLEVFVLPLPPEIQSGCGICLAVKQEEDMKKGIAVLSDAGIPVITRPYL